MVNCYNKNKLGFTPNVFFFFFFLGGGGGGGPVDLIPKPTAVSMHVKFA